MKKILLVSIIIILIAAGGCWWVYNNAESPINDSLVTSDKQAEEKGFDKQQYSLDDPTSQWVIVNKLRPIPVTFVPDLIVPDVQLRLSAQDEQMQINTTTAPAVKEMFTAAKNDGVNLVFGSGYRSTTQQQKFYDAYVAKDGKAGADTYSARPGYSEHQTGFAFDITSPDGKCHLEICWADTPEGQWIASNAYKYGFVIRYPKGNKSITGYQYEPWHVRFVGQDLAKEINQTNKTLEEFFDLPPAPNYD